MTNPNDQSLENVKTPERAEPGDEAEVSLYENEAVDRPPRFRNSQDVLAYVKKSMTERGYSRSEEVIAEIASIVDGPISGEVKATTTDAEGMIKEGEEIAKIHPNMVVKIPMTVEGLKAVKVLTGKGIKTNVTLIFTANQALLAARAGATYVSPFLGRLDDISVSGVELVEEISEIFKVAGIETQIIAASVRNPMHITDCALAGADIATVPYKVIEQMTHHPLTDVGIEKFRKDYIAVFGE